MAQWVRRAAPSASAPSFSGERLEMAKTVSFSMCPSENSLRRSTRATCAMCGKGSCAGRTARAWIARVSMRPWPFSQALRSGGKSRLRKEPAALFAQGRLVVFDDKEIIGASVLDQVTCGVVLGM